MFPLLVFFMVLLYTIVGSSFSASGELIVVSQYFCFFLVIFRNFPGFSRYFPVFSQYFLGFFRFFRYFLVFSVFFRYLLVLPLFFFGFFPVFPGFFLYFLELSSNLIRYFCNFRNAAHHPHRL